MSINRFGNRTNPRSAGVALAHKAHKVKDPTDKKTGQANAKLAGIKEETIQRNLGERNKIATIVMATSHSR
jgi:hypothetical protein